jgi:hypothetical protein
MNGCAVGQISHFECSLCIRASGEFQRLERRGIAGRLACSDLALPSSALLRNRSWSDREEAFLFWLGIRFRNYGHGFGNRSLTVAALTRTFDPDANMLGL